jgi:isoamylase
MSSSSQYISQQGTPFPLGATLSENGTNFSLFSEHAQKVTLLLFEPGSANPFLTLRLDEKKNKTKNVWHIFVKGLKKEIEYAYQIDGPKDPKKGLLFNPSNLLLDPYAKGVSSHASWGEPAGSFYRPRGKVFPHLPFDWEGISKPKINDVDWIIYEMHVRAFTQHESSQVQHKGTFLGIVEKIPYLKSLGINAIELLPVFEFNECENHLKNPKTGQPLYNFWGYSTVNFFCPMQRFASDRNAAIFEFKTMVKELHRNQIAVILDVVYNHTAEGNEEGPALSFRGIDNPVYYILGPDGHYTNFSGTGNTFNCNHPAVVQLILDSLRYWVSEMGVDGFRFDLASVLTRGLKGEPLEKPPLIEAINQDPVLSQVKLIAEAWDLGLYQVGSFPGGGKWSEWNGKYRDIVRRFIKGTDGQIGAFAGSLCGSQDLYGKIKPFHSVNFITAHDGYSLRDLVSYQDKHNLENGEENRDGNNQNDSWNCGFEGETKNQKINALRQRQMKNFQTALMVSLGTPMILMGDEYGHTRKGNNNPYCQDNELNWFLWHELEKTRPFFRFFTLIIEFRKKNCKLFCRNNFLEQKDVDWHGIRPLRADWSAGSRFLACTLKDHEQGNHLYIAFNAHFEPAYAHLPPLDNKQWYRIVDTSLASPHDFREDPKKHPPLPFIYTLSSYSICIAQAF